MAENPVDPAILGLTAQIVSAHASNNELLFQLIAGGVVGAISGTLLSTHIPRRPLRFALWIWLLVLGGQFLFNSYQAWAAPPKEPAVVSHTAQLK